MGWDQAREIDEHIQRRGAAELLIDVAHALVDLRVLGKVIEKAVLDVQPADAAGGAEGEEAACEDQGEGMARRGAAQQLQEGRGAGRGPRSARGQHGHGQGEEDKGHAEGQGNADGHHPAEVHHGHDARGDEGSEGHHGRHGGKKAGPELRAQGGLEALRDRLRRFGDLQLPEADDQVDREADADDDQERSEVRGNHRDGPADGAKEAHHEPRGEGRIGEGQNHPA